MKTATFPTNIITNSCNSMSGYSFSYLLLLITHCYFEIDVNIIKTTYIRTYALYVHNEVFSDVSMLTSGNITAT